MFKTSSWKKASDSERSKKVTHCHFPKYSLSLATHKKKVWLHHCRQVSKIESR